MRWATIVAAIWLALAGGPVQAQAPASPGRMVRIEAFAARQVQPRAVTVWLPADYERKPKQRFPVLYVQDGADAFGPEGLNLDGTITRLSRAGRMRPVIVVAVAGTALRQREYFPSKLYELLPPEYRKSVELVTRGSPMGDAYAAFLATELKPAIDRHYRTLAGPADSWVLGNSMGGLIALYAVGEYPKLFGRGAALSPYWPLGAPIGPPFGTEAGATMAANVFGTWLMRSGADPRVNRLYMDRGTAALDAMFPPFAQKIDALMPGLGWQRDATWQSRVFAGAGHDLKAWRARIDAPLLFLDRR
jgi:enterochelin esterase-like enzyme